MKTLHISVSNKVAEYRERDGFIVCGNSNYQVEFAFDSEWDEHEAKTARFIWNNQYFDQEFTGNVCPCPIIYNTTEVSVGVYAGNLETTTGATIPCRPSILCGETTAHPESGQNYTNEAKAAAEEAKASAESAVESEQNAKSSEEAAHASATAASAAEATAVEAVSGATSRLSAVETQASINSKRITNIERGLDPDLFFTDDAVAYQKTVPEGAMPYAAIERVGGMSYKSKNLLDMTLFSTSNITAVENSDGTVTLTNTTSGAAVSIETLTGKYPAGTYTLHNISGSTLYWQTSSEDYANMVAVGGSKTFTYDGTSYLRILLADFAANETRIYKVMLNEGSTALPFEPYYEGIRHAAGTAIESAGVNLLLHEDYSVTTNGITFTSNADGSVTAIGTATETAYYNFRTNVPMKAGNYFLSGCPQGGTANTYALQLYNVKADGNVQVDTEDFGRGATIRTSYSRDVRGYIVIRKGTTASNLTFYPMLTLEGYSGGYKKAFLHTFPIPEAVQALDGYGWGISKEVNNYFAYNDNGRVTWHKKFGVVDLGSLSWWLAGDCVFIADATALGFKYGMNFVCSIYDAASTQLVNKTIFMFNSYYGNKRIAITDSDYTDPATFKAAMSGVMLYYELETPEVTDITDLISPDNFIEVEAGGTITFVNEHGLAVPSAITFNIKGDAV